MSSIDYSRMMDVIAKGIDCVLTVIQYGIQVVKLRLKEALDICETLRRLEGDMVKTLAMILPRMLSPLEARSLIMNVIKFDRVALMRLEVALGNSFYPLIGIFNGYYSLDLSVENDRVCLTKLLIQNQRHVENCIKSCAFSMGTTGDLSQHGDWSAFRNEVWNGNPAHIDANFFTPMPKTGKISFDFSGEDKPQLHATVMKDSRCISIILNINLVDRQFKDIICSDLAKMKNVSRENVGGDGKFVPICDKNRAEDIQFCMHKFYNRLSKRAAQHAQSVMLENLHGMGGAAEMEEDSDTDDDSQLHCVFGEDDNDVMVSLCAQIPDTLIEATSRSRLTRELSHGEDIGNLTVPRRGGLVTLGSLREATSGSPTSDALGIEARTVDESKALETATDTDAPETEEVLSHRIEVSGDITAAVPVNTKKRDHIVKMNRSKKMLCEHSQAIIQMRKSRKVNCYSKCNKIVGIIVDMLTRVFIRARHLALIVKWFHLGRANRTRHFGSYRVDLIVYLFGRIVDLHNFDLVVAVLTPYEVACLNCRIGILNIFNPMKPEGCICLNISRREERIVTKILALLSVSEPGANWVDSSFRWEIDGNPMPGWELTQGWMTVSGMPHKGFLFTNYSASSGCRANIAGRKGFLCMVSVDICITCLF